LRLIDTVTAVFYRMTHYQRATPVVSSLMFWFLISDHDWRRQTDRQYIT